MLRVESDGHVVWAPPMMYTVHCEVSSPGSGCSKPRLPVEVVKKTTARPRLLKASVACRGR